MERMSFVFVSLLVSAVFLSLKVGRSGWLDEICLCALTRPYLGILIGIVHT